MTCPPRRRQSRPPHDRLGDRAPDQGSERLLLVGGEVGQRANVTARNGLVPAQLRPALGDQRQGLQDGVVDAARDVGVNLMEMPFIELRKAARIILSSFYSLAFVRFSHSGYKNCAWAEKLRY